MATTKTNAERLQEVQREHGLKGSNPALYVGTYRKYSQSEAIAAAKRLAGQEAGMLVYDANGKKKLEHKFKFKDTFRDNLDRIWIDIEEEGDVIGRWIMYQYDTIIELARIGIVDVDLPRGGVRRTFLLNY